MPSPLSLRIAIGASLIVEYLGVGAPQYFVFVGDCCHPDCCHDSHIPLLIQIRQISFEKREGRFGLDLPFSSWGGILPAILAGTEAVCGLGLLLGGLGYLVLDAWVLGNLMIFTLLLLSGANVPLDEFQSFVGLIGRGLPLTRSIEAARLLAGYRGRHVRLDGETGAAAGDAGGSVKRYTPQGQDEFPGCVGNRITYLVKVLT